MKTSPLQQAITELLNAFTVSTRKDGEEYVHCKDDAPEWVRETVRDAHGEMLPDDTKYSMIQECADALDTYADEDSDADSLRDMTGEIADSLVDVYNGDRVRWLASHTTRADYIDDAQQEGLISADADTFTRLGIGQYMEYQEILNALIEACAERAEEIDDAAAEGEDE